MNAPAPNGTIRLMTWNIHGGVGPDRRFDLDRVAAVIRRHAPDILALQELDTRGRDAMCLAPLRTLATPDGHFAEARTIVVPDGHYGHALFSRAPMGDILVHDLSVRRREPRSAIEAVVATASGPLHVVAVHLGLDIAERNRQARILARLAREPKGVGTVMLGDFNDWFSFGRVRKTLAAVLATRTSLATFPAARPVLKLDRAYSSMPGSIINAWTDPEGRDCSDHLPLIVDVRLGEARRGHQHVGGTLQPGTD